ncbi:MAG TPA: phosphopentomutase, partial [Alphaproteobacteria bacterium]|nr:phosphopentomutase [Alphaproteobacteria bacterium]
HASGTAIIAELGDEHCRSGKPIVYTSADSVFQIAAHEEAFGLDRLYAVCEVARGLCDPLNIGRVIARPFT